MEALTTMGTLAVTEAIKELSKKMASFVAEKVSKYYKDTTNKEMIDAGWAFETYLEKVYETYSKSKSILYESEARELSSFFEPVDLQLRFEHYLLQSGRKSMRKVEKNSVRLSSKEIDKILIKGSKKIIIGNGGTGKTMLMKHFCTAAIESGYGIPVFISLRWFNNMEIGNEPFEELIYEQLKVFRFELEYEYFKYSLEGDRYIFLFDGFDEISREKRSLITEKLYNFSKKYEDNCFVITSRETEGIVGWDQFTIFEMCPLELEQAVRLIRRLDFDMQSKTRFVQELYNGVFQKYQACTSVPLLLSILFLTFVIKTTIPESLQKFYEEAFETMLYRHDKKKEGFERVLESKLSYSEFRDVFEHFCFLTYFNDEYSFSEQRLLECISEAAELEKKVIDAYAYSNDLRYIVCMLIRDGCELTFLHRNFQEYFAARYASSKPDAKQSQLCSALINQEDKIPGIKLFWKTKAMEFLKTLKQVEPQKFESIVMLPILNKLYALKLECKGNLAEMLSKYFYFDIMHDAGPRICVYYYIIGDRDDNPIGYSEFYALIDYYSDMFIKSDPHLLVAIHFFTKINEASFQSGEPASQKMLSFGVYQKDDSTDIKEDTKNELLKCFAVCLKRYDELVQENSTKGKLKDIVKKF